MAFSRNWPSGTMENKLTSFSCKTSGDDIRPVCLMGLVSMEKTEEETEGWILVISGDPLIPHIPGAPFRNKIAIDRLRLTSDQKLAIVESSVVRDGHVYLYGGNFSVGKCTRSRECKQHNLNILKVLSDHLSKHILELDLTQVVPLKEKLLSKIVMPRHFKKKKSFGGGGSLGRGDPRGQGKSGAGETEKKEKLRFRCTDHQSFLELECPVNHTGYHVGVLLLETFVCKPNVLDVFDRSRITRIVEQADIIVPPNFNCHICAANEEPLPEWITLTVKGFQMPVYENRCERRILDNFMVRWVEYRGMAYFIKYGEWKGMTIQKLLVEQVDGKEDLRKEAIRLSSSSSKTTVGGKEAYSSPSMGSSSSGAYPHCAIPVKLVVMEVELDGDEEKEEEKGEEKEEEKVKEKQEEKVEDKEEDPKEEGEEVGNPESTD